MDHPLSDRATDALREWARRAPACRLLVVFGSAVSRDRPPGRASDVDLAVWFPDLPAPVDRLRIIGELQDCVSPARADVVFLHPDTDPVLRFEVFRTGVPLHEAGEGVFTSQVVRALALYEDALPFRRALRASLQRGARGGTVPG